MTYGFYRGDGLRFCANLCLGFLLLLNLWLLNGDRVCSREQENAYYSGSFAQLMVLIMLNLCL